ncbi:MAG TPA: glycosyltransferase [Gammaproteobacteria bacterium]|nr:glycosyltransferase [Gammaproteobacteria bacterium]
MRVVLLARSLGSGGTERQLCNLATGLRARGHEVSVGVFYRGGAFEATLGQAGIPVWSLGKKGRWDTVGPARSLVRRLRGSGIEVLYSFLTPPNALAALLRPVLGRVRVVWGVRSCRKEPAQYGRAGRLAMALESRLSRLAHRIITNSEAARNFYVGRGFPAERTIAIPNGIDLAVFAPDGGGRAALRGQWGAGDGQVLVGMVARLDPLKDHPTFLRAAALVAQRAPEMRFVCVGEGDADYRRELESLAGQCGLTGRLRWAGGQADVAGAYRALDLHVSASCSEGFPNAVAEAMACGVPNVVTDVGDSARIVGETGQVVAPRNPAALAEAILEALARSHDPAFLRGRMEAEFSLDRMVTRTESELLGLLD